MFHLCCLCNHFLVWRSLLGSKWFPKSGLHSLWSHHYESESCLAIHRSSKQGISSQRSHETIKAFGKLAMSSSGFQVVWALCLVCIECFHRFHGVLHRFLCKQEWVAHFSNQLLQNLPSRSLRPFGQLSNTCLLSSL
jgi:hypothetical protein